MHTKYYMQLLHLDCGKLVGLHIKGYYLMENKANYGPRASKHNINPWLCYNWYDKLVQKTNSKGYAVQLFCINIETPPPLSVLVGIGKQICEHINSYPDNKTTTLVDEKDFIWIKSPTWVEIIGLVAAQKRLEETIGPFHENTYIQHPDTVHFFKK